MTCATSPNALATVSSLKLGCPGRDKGGAGSEEENGTGRGTVTMVKRRSLGSKGSIGKIDERV